MKKDLQRGARVLAGYAPLLTLTDGRGCYVRDDSGKEYLDLGAGIAVNTLGYAHPRLVQNLEKQIPRLWHISNFFASPQNIRLAEFLLDASGMDRVFFCNSGTEANEGLLKLSRLYGLKEKNIRNPEVIVMKGSFHGRTLGALSLTAQEKYQEDFRPLLSGVRQAELNRFDSVRAAVSEKTCAIFIEPVQGENGIRPATKEFLKQLRRLCTKEKIMLIFDEVQCGIGRLGTLFAGETFGVKPDAVALAKGLGGGFPIGAFLGKEKFMRLLTPGKHASTFGGNIPASVAALTVLKEVSKPAFLRRVLKTGEFLKTRLRRLQKQYPSQIKEIRGTGLMLGLELTFPAAPLLEALRAEGVLLLPAGERVIRFVPPLIIKQAEIKEGLRILEQALRQEHL